MRVVHENMIREIPVVVPVRTPNQLMGYQFFLYHFRRYLLNQPSKIIEPVQVFPVDRVRGNINRLGISEPSKYKVERGLVKRAKRTTDTGPRAIASNLPDPTWRVRKRRSRK